ncbi:MAG: RidA family protein [SAR202 cluster bacterium]|nr:RidA family protein [SAR202 cluster bacterium]|tara:strand:+ start:1817 stop:2212 length:396 start_codon:yes stop_codon:yes gene_type:complete
MSEIKRINPEKLAQPPGDRYAHVVQYGNLIWISGQTSRDTEGKVIGRGDTLAQARQVNKNLQTAIEAAGGDMDNIVKVTIFLTPEADIEAARQAQNEYRAKFAAPASSMVIVQALANPEYLIEVEAFAVIN